jgi:hypothetical protein
VARDVSSAAVAGASTASRVACCTSVLRCSRQPLLRALADASTIPAVGRGPYLVALDRHVGSTIIGQLLQHHGLDSPTVTNWVADSGACNHTTSDVSNLTFVHSPTSTDPSSIVGGNGSALPITSVGYSALPSPFYLNNDIITPNIIQNLLSVYHFTTDNLCSMEFDLFGLSVKDISMWNVVTMCNSSGPLYMMRLPSHPAPSSPVSTPSALVASVSTWHRHLSLVQISS